MPTLVAAAIGVLIAIVGIIVASITGAGAGGLVVPAFNIFLCYSLSESVSLWNIVVWLNSSYGVFLCAYRNERHPEGEHKPVIDFDSVLMFLPLLFLGVELGFILVDVLSEGVKMVCLSLMLICISVFTFFKAVDRYKLESTPGFGKGDGGELGLEFAWPEVASPSRRSMPPGLGSQPGSVASSPVRQRQSLQQATWLPTEVEKAAILDREGRYFPVFKTGLSILCVAVLTFFHLMIGTSKQKSVVGVTPCSSAYWWLISGYVASMVTILWVSYKILQNERRRKAELGIFPMLSEFEWTGEMVLKIAVFAILSGSFSVGFGVGGTLILSFIFVCKDVHPEVTTATTMLCIVYVCFSTSLLYSINRITPTDGFAILVMVMAIPLTILANARIREYVRGRASILLFVLFGALLVTSVVVVVFGSYKAHYLDRNTHFWESRRLCPK